MRLQIKTKHVIKHDGIQVPLAGTSSLTVVVFRDGGIGWGYLDDWEWEWAVQDDRSCNIVGYVFVDFEVIP